MTPSERSLDGAPTAHSAARVAIPALAGRAVVVWGMSRLVFTAVVMAAGMAPGSMPAPPIAVVVLAGVLGLLDVHMRGERILWANLGAGAGLLYLIHAAAAVAGEIVLAFVSR